MLATHARPGRLTKGALAGGGCLLLGAAVPYAPVLSGVVAVAALFVGIAIHRPSFGSTLLMSAYLVPLFALGRVFSVVGAAPLYLTDVLLVGALLASAQTWWPVYRSRVPSWYKAGTVVFAGVGLLSTLKGMHAGYPTALKGLVLVVYPLISGPAGAWIAVYRKEWDRTLLVAASAAPIGLAAMTILAPNNVIPAAAGFYMTALVAIALSRPIGPLRRLLVIDALFGTIVLATTGSRGPMLAMLAAFAAAEMAGKGRTATRAQRIAPLLLVGTALLLAAVGFDPSGSGRLPIVGKIVERTGNVISAPGSEAEANVTFRGDLWRYSLTTVARSGPLLGVGMGRPFDLSFRGVSIGQRNIGAHNSYVGVTYAMGIPAGLGFLAFVLLALRAAIRRRRSDAIAVVQIGWLVGGMIIMFTNVALETPYMGGPLWILLGWCVLHDGAPGAIEADTLAAATSRAG